MRRLTMVAVSLVAVTGLSALGQEAAKAPAPPTFSSPDGRTPISIPGPMILQIGPPPSVYSPAADFKARIGNAAMVAVLSDDGTQAPSNVVQITDIQADPTSPVLMQAFSLPGFSPTAMPTLPPPGCFVQVPTGYMPPPPAYLPVATRLSIPNPMFPYGGFPTCDAPPACSANCCRLRWLWLRLRRFAPKPERLLHRNQRIQSLRAHPRSCASPRSRRVTSRRGPAPPPLRRRRESPDSRPEGRRIRTCPTPPRIVQQLHEHELKCG